VPRVLVVVFEEELPGLLVQGRLGKRLDQEAANHEKNVPDAEVRFPVFLQNINTYLTVLCYVWVENFSKKVSCDITEWPRSDFASAIARDNARRR
jgi:hypothetical protein